ncbi:MAG: alpha-L-fucosidase [Ferruginibacter sp.]
MLKKNIFFSLLIAFSVTAMAQVGKLKPANTIAIEKTDSREIIISKAANVIPTANQLTALKDAFIAFIHFGPNTFTGMEWGTGKEDPEIFDPRNIDTDQWCSAIKAAGMKKVILTAKHHDGFVLWQSRYTQHGVMSSPYKNGKGDVLKELAASCKKYGLKLGIYLSPADLYQIESPDGLYGNLSKPTLRTIPRQVEGRPFASKRRFSFMVDDYNEYFLNQLFELLTEYGTISEVWFDGAHPKRKGGQQYNYIAWKKLIRTLAPQAVIFGKEDIRWCGNEGGATRATEWNVIPYKANPDTMNSFSDLEAASLGSREELYQGRYLHYQPAETNTSIREGWFYRNDPSQKVRNVDDVFDIYERSVGGNSIFLLNIPPDRQGRFAAEDSAVLYEAGQRIHETYGNNLFARAKGPAALLDNRDRTFLLLHKNAPEIIVTTASPVTINRLQLQEAVAMHGERAELHAVDAWINNEWREIAAATNIGYKRILRFPAVTAQKFRIRILQSRAPVALNSVAAFYSKPRPPQLSLQRDAGGMVSIAPASTEFRWNSNRQGLTENFRVYYTTGNEQPGNNSRLYTGPFELRSGTVKAIALVDSLIGPVAEQTFGILQQSWKLIQANSEQKEHPATAAFDGDKNTWWQTAENTSPHFIMIDLGAEHLLKGFRFTPAIKSSGGLPEYGFIQSSANGQTWQDAGYFNFGNIVNDPSPRTTYFETVLRARYVRFEVKRMAANATSLTVAELDFLE